MKKEKTDYQFPAVFIVKLFNQSVLCQSGNSLEDWHVEEQDIFNS